MPPSIHVVIVSDKVILLERIVVGNSVTLLHNGLGHKIYKLAKNLFNDLIPHIKKAPITRIGALAPRTGLEPVTFRLTAERSTD